MAGRPKLAPLHLAPLPRELRDDPGENEPLIYRHQLTVAQTAIYLGLSEETIRRAIRSGELKAKPFGRAIRVRRVDAEAYVDDRPDYQPRVS